MPTPEEIRRGFSTGTAPTPPTRRFADAPPAVPPAPLPGAVPPSNPGPFTPPPAPAPRGLGLSRGVISSETKEERRRRKIARGEQLTQEDL